MKELLVILVSFALIDVYECSIAYDLVGTQDGILLTVKQGDNVKLNGKIGVGLNFTDENCVKKRNCPGKEFDIVPYDDYLTIIWESTDTTAVFEDCFSLEVGHLNWFGGPQTFSQLWPIEKISLDGSLPYIVRKDESYAIVERYWLNSRGIYIFIEDGAPLYIDQNTKQDGQVCFIAKVDGPYFNRTRNFFSYYMGVLDNARDAHLHAVNNFLGKPTGHPNPKMIKEPIWTTWAKYKKDINDEIVLSFARDLRDHGFENGQLEIDDDWEGCYGSQVFRQDNFGNITNTIKTLKDDNWRVTLWIHPFVNSDCQNNSDIGNEKGYFVRNINGSTEAQWWDGDDSHQIDFTNPEAVEWFTDRVKKLQTNPGIDSFKFDAGETDYVLQPAVYENVDQELVPNILSNKYVTACSTFGDLIEIRSAWRTQQLPVFVRMIDKSSNWEDSSNGLHSLITTLLQMNINGYTMVLPDMIGGNGYGGELPTAELIARWTQANTFMPAMQFSYLPWDITSDDFDGVEILKKYVKLHADYADHILKAMNESIAVGTPVNPPIWWVDPTNSEALANDDEYLLGESILVAPVIVQGAVCRDVYLPKGNWKDGNNGTEYSGPILIKDYPAPIDILPYFIKV